MDLRECKEGVTAVYHRYKPGVRAGYAVPTKLKVTIIKAHKTKVSVRFDSGEVTSVHPEHLEMMK
jgi:hypothetical protein